MFSVQVNNTYHLTTLDPHYNPVHLVALALAFELLLRHN
jgi:hypothetical protein